MANDVVDDEAPALPDGVLAVRVGPGANCSSIGSVVDLLFAAAAIVGATYAAIAIAIGDAPTAPPPPAPARRAEGDDA